MPQFRSHNFGGSPRRQSAYGARQGHAKQRQCGNLTGHAARALTWQYDYPPLTVTDPLATEGNDARSWPGHRLALCHGLAGQPLRLGAATITVYWQHGVLDARVWPLVAWWAHRRPLGPW